MIQPYTKEDLERGEAVVKELHGLRGFDAWAERIAKEIAAERERMRAAQSTILHRLARLIDNAGPVSPGCDTQSWGAGFQTAHQMALNIVNAALEQK